METHNMKNLLVAAALLAASLPASAATQGPRVQVNIFWGEDASCNAWLKSTGNKSIRSYYDIWVRGFVSGYNYGNPERQVRDGALPVSDALHQYLDQYCRANPTLSFTGGAIQLVEQLRDSVTPARPAPVKPTPAKPAPAKPESAKEIPPPSAK